MGGAAEHAHSPNIADCVKNLPFHRTVSSLSSSAVSSPSPSHRQCNLLILEFSQLCDVRLRDIDVASIDSFSFRCRLEFDEFDGVASSSSSPLFDVDHLCNASTANKVYIHVLLSESQRDCILRGERATLRVELIAHIQSIPALIGSIAIDIRKLAECQLI